MHCRCVLFLPNSDTTLHGGRTHGQGRSRCWLGKLSHRQRAAFLLEVMHELTIAVRAIFHDHAGDSDLCARSVYDVSELNHRLTSAAISMLANKPTYPALIDMIFGASVDPELSTYLPVLERAALKRAINWRLLLKCTGFPKQRMLWVCSAPWIREDIRPSEMSDRIAI